LRQFADLDDAARWRFIKFMFDVNQPPPQDAFDRCTRFDNFSLHLASPIQNVVLKDDQIEIKIPQGLHHADFLIAGTGFVVDLATRPELSRIEAHIARWSDRYRPPTGEEHAGLGAYPYLSGYFQFLEKTPGTAPYLKNIFCYTYGAVPSLASTAGISQLKFGADRIGFGITPMRISRRCAPTRSANSTPQNSTRRVNRQARRARGLPDRCFVVTVANRAQRVIESQDREAFCTRRNAVPLQPAG
jgi:FAD-dependent urate hydroxylase